jgi:hypothetical protein
MKYCPLMSFRKSGSVHQRIPCLEAQCGFADETGNCLIKDALKCFIIREQSALSQEAHETILKDCLSPKFKPPQKIL